MISVKYRVWNHAYELVYDIVARRDTIAVVVYLAAWRGIDAHLTLGNPARLSVCERLSRLMWYGELHND